jgi:hypothetical protein
VVQDATRGTSRGNRDARPSPFYPAPVALTVSLSPGGGVPTEASSAPFTALRLSRTLALRAGFIRADRPLPECPFRTTPNQTHRGVGAIMGRQWASAGSPRALSSVPWRACVLGLSTSGTRRPSAPRTRLRSTPRRLPYTVLSGVRRDSACTNRTSQSSRFTCKTAFFAEPTSGLEPLTCSLRVRCYTYRGIPSRPEKARK